MKERRILIFQDGVMFKTSPEKRRYINVLTQALIGLIREPGFEYVAVDPVICAEKLGEQISPDGFSSAIDLSGLFTTTLRQKGIPTSDEFKISRLRKTSSPLLDGVGFLTNVTSEESSRIKTKIEDILQVDGRRVLLIDDVGWSGRTIRAGVRLFNIPTSRCAIGLLVANRGSFGFGNVITELEKLEREGVILFAGEEVRTPQDDGYHLADFVIGDETNFDAILEIQKLRETFPSTLDEEHDKKRKEILEALQGVLEGQQKKLFPNAINSEQAQKLVMDGRIITKEGISKNSFFDTNPPNWLMPSFSRIISSKTLTKNKRGIIDVTSELQEVLELSKEDRETRKEHTERRGGKEIV